MIGIRQRSYPSRGGEPDVGVEAIRSLVITPATPWGPDTGLRVRLQMVLEGLRRVGSVQVCVLGTHPAHPADDSSPAPDGVEWVEVEPRPWRRVRALAPGGCPEPLARISAPSPVLTGDAGFDLAWCSEPRSVVALHERVAPAIVLDLPNLPAWSVRHEHASPMRHRFAHTGPTRAWLRRGWYLPLLARRWDAWQHEVAGRVDAVTVCSDLDRDRLGASNTVVIANAPRTPDSSRGSTSRRAGRHDPFVLGFVGTLRYGPNQQGVRFLVREVLDRVRDAVPGARLRLVGDGQECVTDLCRHPGVEASGYAPSLDAALADVDVVVAPIFFGGGTRLKILDAFARGIPVVSTTVGAEGLDVAGGQHLLLADDAPAFARAIVALYRSPELREQLAGRARRRYEERYPWDRGVGAVEELAHRLLDVRARAGAR